MSEGSITNRRGNRGERWVRRMRVYFVLLADAASFYEVLDEGGESWPPIVM
jgi:hypothetical protein